MQIGIRSSTTARVRRKMRMAEGRNVPTPANTATAKAMSVAVGMAQPCIAVGLLKLIAV